jgi:hypothetical protein
MHCFNDKNGQQWTLDLTVGSARRVKAACNVDLINLVNFDENTSEASELERLVSDPCLLVSVVYTLCEKQAVERSLDGEAFADVFSGETIENAINALIEEIISFSPPMRRKMLAKMYQTSQNLMGKMSEDMERTLEDPEFLAALEEQLMKSFTGSPE